MSKTASVPVPSFPIPLMTMCAIGILTALPSCGGSEDSAKVKQIHEKSAKLKLEADQLATEAAMIQEKIRDYGSTETTSDKIVGSLAAEQKSAEGEGARLEKIAADLKLAHESLLKEQAAFGQKYLQPLNR